MSRKKNSPARKRALQGTDAPADETVERAEAMEKNIPQQAHAESGAQAERAEEQQGKNDLVAVVGVGASAGGLEAFRELLEPPPVETGMAFVLVMHLDPKHESILRELLEKSTALPVIEVKDGTPVTPDYVYVMPRNTSMTIEGGVLRLQPREKGRGQHRPIDAFLRSLAEDQGPRAIGVILSGTATDGTLGPEAVKAEGGITFAQEPKSAQYDGMPRSAIVAVDLDGVITSWNQGAEWLYGYTAQEAIAGLSQCYFSRNISRWRKACWTACAAASTSSTSSPCAGARTEARSLFH